ncbi:aminodeoxychorismate synthase component I [Legionella nagasakiensis]|uniref:aminodeoxychorismate synthase component I n=1 Tax=Legionella nagasakiensis TaxID=535290 RepID=UPI001054BA41|nr:aminodeoxychorismate synthase component I [Legionella nagasakiensis]
MSNIAVYPLDYSENLIDRYYSLSHLPGFVLLESSDENKGRYDIISAYHYDEFKIYHDTDINFIFSQIQERLSHISSMHDFPFQGGAIGYFSYDFGAKLFDINSPIHPLLATMPMVHLRFYDWAILADHKTKQVHLITANLKSETIHIIKEIRKRWSQSSVSNQSCTLRKPFVPLISKENYQQAFQAIHQELTRGRAYQVNYTQAFLASYSGDPWEMYCRIRNRNPVPFSAFLRSEEAEILSFSPERFLLLNEKTLLASPIKGSARRSHDMVIDNQWQKALVSCPKNQAENIMIVDLLRNDLGKIAVPGSVKVKSLCELQSFNSVHHLVSHIEAQCLENIQPLEAFAACFPGGSITGAPKREAMRIIAEHEPFARGVYCGSIGYFSRHGRFDTNIAIRTITAKDGYLYLPVGGGIVIDSTCEEEYLECYTKIKAIMNNLVNYA